jgi:hypothetical protein
MFLSASVLLVKSIPPSQKQSARFSAGAMLKSETPDSSHALLKWYAAL